MKTFRIEQTFEVEADTREEALRKVRHGGGDLVDEQVVDEEPAAEEVQS